MASKFFMMIYLLLVSQFSHAIYIGRGLYTLKTDTFQCDALLSNQDFVFWLRTFKCPEFEKASVLRIVSRDMLDLNGVSISPSTNGFEASVDGKVIWTLTERNPQNPSVAGDIKQQARISDLHRYMQGIRYLIFYGSCPGNFMIPIQISNQYGEIDSLPPKTQVIVKACASNQLWTRMSQDQVEDVAVGGLAELQEEVEKILGFKKMQIN